MTSPDTIKFTMLLNPEDDARFQRVVNTVIDLAGIRPKKGQKADIIRQAIILLDENPALLEQLAKRINAASEMTPA